VRISQLVKTFRLELLSKLTEDVDIRGVRPLDKAQTGDLSFLTNPKYRQQAQKTKASAVLVREAVPDCGAVQLGCNHPYLVLANVLEHLFPEPVPEPEIHPSAVIAESATVPEDCYVGPHCVVEKGAVIGSGSVLVHGVSVGAGCVVGEDCKLFPHVVLYPGTALGNRVRVHANSVLGSDGFGYAQSDGVHIKVPQIGGVIVGDDVEIGSNVSIDRGALDNTVIGNGVKIDNLVQIAHGARVGEHGMIISQSGVSGSSSLGKHTILAGQVGVVGHIEIGDGIIVMGDSVVTKNLKEPGRYAGNPAVPFMTYQRQQAEVRRLPELVKRVKKLENQKDGDKK